MDYKKRDIKKVKIPKSDKSIKKIKPPVSNTEKIEMKPGSSKSNKDVKRAPTDIQPKSRKPVFKKIDGGAAKSAKQKHSRLNTAIISIAIIFIIVCLQFATPTGMYDYMQNALVSMGGGNGLPVEIAGNKAKGLFSNNNAFFTLTDTSLYAHNTNGKEITSIQHGYVSPCVVVSNQRTLIYDRGNTDLRIDSLYTNYVNKSLDNKIYTADISQSGRLAVVTEKSGYAANLTVYSKNYSDVLMQYSSADHQISCVKLSPNGRYVAFSTISIDNGTYYSTLKICKISTKEIISETRIDNIMVVKLAVSSSNLFIQGTDKLFTIDWKGNNFKEYNYSDMTCFVDNGNGFITVAYHPSGDSRITDVTSFNKYAKEKFTARIHGTVNSVCSYGNYIYIMADNTVYKYNKNGLVNSFEIGYQYNFIASHKNGVVSFSDMKINYNK